MLILALVVSAILFFIANWFSSRSEHPVPKIVGTAVLFAIAPAVMCTILPPVFFQALLLGAGATVLGLRNWRPRHFLLLSCAATFVAFAVPGYFAFQQTRHLQEEFPYTSIVDRLPPADAHLPVGSLSHDASTRLSELEEAIEHEDHWVGWRRTYTLRQIHEETVKTFLNRPGFGTARMVGFSEDSLKQGLRQEPPIPHPGHPSASPWLSELLTSGPLPTDDLLSLHQSSVADFVNPAGFGFVKDRQHVAGFQAHQVGHLPEAPERWKIQTLDLVGLIVHRKPVAYTSDNLPRMDELRSAPMRALDEFESAGLAALQRGEDLFVRERERERRMFGSIRAARQCLSCHDCERGRLLGAFSYTMTRDPK